MIGATGTEHDTSPKSHEAFIRALYRALLLREPDPGGLVAGLKMMQNGASFEEAISSCLKSKEFAARYRSFVETYVKGKGGQSAERT